MALAGSIVLRTLLFAVLFVGFLVFFLYVPNIVDWTRALMGKGPGDPLISIVGVASAMLAGTIAFIRVS